jgi:tetratricopeptide (TPR) repeat protein
MSNESCPIRRNAPVVFVLLLTIGVFLPAGIFFWKGVLEDFSRSKLASRHIKAGDEAFESGDFERAVVAYSSARSLMQSADVVQKLTRARLYMFSVKPEALQNADQNEVNYLLEFMQKTSPKDASVCQAIAGHMALQRGDLDGATNIYRGILGQDPDNPAAHLGLAFVAMRSRKADDARKELEAVVKKLPNHREALVSLAELEVQAGDVDKAMERLEKALRISDDARLHYVFGLCYSKKNQIRKAVQEYQLAIRMNPNFREAHMELANLLLSAGLYAEAERSYRSALNISQDEEALTGLATALNKQQRFEEAFQAIGVLAGTKSASPFTVIQAAVAAEGMGKKDVALGFYKKAESMISELEQRLPGEVVASLKKQVQEGIARTSSAQK